VHQHIFTWYVSCHFSHTIVALSLLAQPGEEGFAAWSLISMPDIVSLLRQIYLSRYMRMIG
jgi:hypothetical protein